MKMSFGGIRLAGAAIVLAAFCVSQVEATVYTLIPGAFVPALSSGFPVGGSVINTSTHSFSAGVLSGTLISDVISGDASNPYGGLTFTYELNISSSSLQGASQLTVSSFDSFFTDVSYNNSGGGVVPSNFSRSSEGGTLGEVVRFSFFSPAVSGGEHSALLVVQTSATIYNVTEAGVIDGQTANVLTFAPLVVPEPTAAVLLLAGLGALAIARRRQA